VEQLQAILTSTYIRQNATLHIPNDCICEHSCDDPNCSCNPWLYISDADVDENGGWIELTNPTDTAISTRGLYLSTLDICGFWFECDDCLDSDFFQWQMPSFIVRANATVKVRANGNVIDVVHKRMTTNFDFNFGDTLYLTTAKKEIISTFDTDDSISGVDWSFDPASGTLTITTNAGTTNWRDGRGSDTFRILDVKNVVIQSGVTIIGYGAFWDCTNLESIAIPNGITSIGNNAFRGCTSLTSITIPNTVTSIGNSAFQYCTITSITIPAGVTSIGSWAFIACTNLIEIIFERATPPSFGDDVWEGTPNSSTVYVPHGSFTAYRAVFDSRFNIIER
jgi:hypothetical protein